MTLKQVTQYLNQHALTPDANNLPYISLYYKLLQQSQDQKRINRKQRKEAAQ